MAKEKTTLKVTVLADEVIFKEKTYKQGDEFTMDLKDPVSEGLIVGGAVIDTAEYKKALAAEEAAEKADVVEDASDGSR